MSQTRTLKEHLRKLTFTRRTPVSFECKLIGTTRFNRYKLKVLNMGDHYCIDNLRSKNPPNNLIFHTYPDQDYKNLFIDTYQFDKPLVEGDYYTIKCILGYNNKYNVSYRIKKVVNVSIPF